MSLIKSSFTKSIKLSAIYGFEINFDISFELYYFLLLPRLTSILMY